MIPPIIDPVIKLAPIIKLIGNKTVLFTNKLTLLLLELFWIPIIKIRNKQQLKVIGKSNFFNNIYNHFDYSNISTNYK